VQSLGVSPTAYTLYRLRVRQAISSNASPLQPASMGEGETADAIVFIIHFIRSQRAKEHLCRIGPRERHHLAGRIRSSLGCLCPLQVVGLMARRSSAFCWSLVGRACTTNS
jgi:hypothetical protein